MRVMHETRRLSTNELLGSVDVTDLSPEDRALAREDAEVAIGDSDDTDRCVVQVERDAVIPAAAADA